MSNEKSVTTAQVGQIRKMANEKSVGREVFQTRLLDSGVMSRVLDAIKDGSLIGNIHLIPPLGGRIHVVKVKVQLDQEWQAAIDAGEPDTLRCLKVRKAGNSYLPTDIGIVEEELILLNYREGEGGWEKALAWGENFRLRKTDPRCVFALGKKYPRFNREVGSNAIFVVSTKECIFNDSKRACYVMWDCSGRQAGLADVGLYNSGNDWFAFRR